MNKPDTRAITIMKRNMSSTANIDPYLGKPYLYDLLEGIDREIHQGLH